MAAGVGAKAFHAWLPKIITFSTMSLVRRKKKSILAVENHRVYSIDRHYLSIYLKLSLPEAGSSIVID